MPAYWFQARRRYFVKHHGRLYGAACDAAWLSGHAIYLAKQRLRRREQAVRPRLWRDFASYSLKHALEPAPRAVQNAGLPGSEDADSRGPGPDERPAAALPLEELWKEDLATHDHDLKNPGFWAIAVHRLAEAADRPESSRLRRSLLKSAHAALSTGIDWLWGIHIPASVELGRRVRLFQGSMSLNARSIGNDVHIRHHTTFGPTSGGNASPRDLPTIEERAAIGAGACVLGAVNVGRGSVVEDNAVVLQDVPPRATATGIPARVAAGAAR
jgi:serine O-acetyltransferase